MERLRYVPNKPDADKRYCKSCPALPDTEFHFLLECAKHKDHRKIMLDKVQDIFPQFDLLQDGTKDTVRQLNVMSPNSVRLEHSQYLFCTETFCLTEKRWTYLIEEIWGADWLSLNIKLDPYNFGIVVEQFSSHW